MVTRIVGVGLFVQMCYAATITDSFLHQGCVTDYVIFYTNAPVKIHEKLYKHNDNINRDTTNQNNVDRVVISFEKTRAARAQLLTRLNTKEIKDYTFSCVKQGHDITCIFTYQPNKIIISCKTQKNWHDIYTIIITCKRLHVPEVKKNSNVIVIDAGHGGRQSGARGLQGLVEKDITLMFARKLQICLTAHGYQALLTRDGDYDVPLDERTSFANKHGAKLLISLHCNYAQNKRARGIEIIYSTQKSKLFADSLHKKLAHIPIDGLVDRGVKLGMLQTTFGCECPAALVELFFLSNPEDVRLLKDQQVQKRIINALCTLT